MEPGEGGAGKPAPSQPQPIPTRTGPARPPAPQLATDTPPSDGDEFVAVDSVGADPGPGADGSGSSPPERTYLEFLTDLKEAAKGEPAVSREEPSLRPKLLKANVQRFSAALEPIGAAFSRVRRLQTWENPPASALALILYYVLVYYRSLVPGLFACLSVLLGVEYLKEHGVISRAKSDAPPAKEATKLRERVSFVAVIAQKVQNHLGRTADFLEKIINLLTWKVPENTLVVSKVLGAALVVTLLLPFDWVFLGVQLWLGVKLFITEAIYHHFPAVKKRFDSTANFFARLPRNCDLEAGLTAEPTMSEEARGDAKPARARLSSGQATETTAAKPPRSPKATHKKKPSDPVPDVLVDWLGCDRAEELLGMWHCFDLSKGTLLSARKGKLYLTKKHLCFVRGNGDPSSGSISVPLTTLVRVARVKPISYMPKGFALEFAATVKEKEVKYVFGALMSRDDVQLLVCQEAGLPVEIPSD